MSHENTSITRLRPVLPTARSSEDDLKSSHPIASSAETTTPMLDSGHQKHVRALSRRTREVEMRYDDLRRRLPTIAPGPVAHALTSAETTPDTHVVALRRGITPNHTVSIHLFPLFFILLFF